MKMEVRNGEEVVEDLEEWPVEDWVDCAWELPGKR
jgi:hypothetical protein